MEVSAFCTATWQITPSAMAGKPKIVLAVEIDNTILILLMIRLATRSRAERKITPFDYGT
jgi:hypothetical protein